jgi:hypothetical protein
MNYNATISLARFENKNIFFYALAYYNAGDAVVNSEVVGLAPGIRGYEDEQREDDSLTTIT